MAEPTHLGDVVTKQGIKLPMWAWGVVALAGAALAYYLYKRRQAANAAAAAANQSAATTAAATPQYQNPVTILPMFQGNTATPQTQQPLYPPGTQTGFWYTLPRDMYSTELAQHAYNLRPYNGGPDFSSLAIDAMWIELANPNNMVVQPGGLISAGTKVFVPGMRVDDVPGAQQWAQSTRPATWDGTMPGDSGPPPNYVSPPAAAATSSSGGS